MSAQPNRDLEKSAHELLQEMEKLITGSQNPAFNTQLAMRALHKFAGVLAVVSLAADKHSRRLVYLTWALVILTAVLLGYTAFLYRDAHADIHHRTLSAQRSDANPVEYISLRETILEKPGIVRITIRNNDAFPIRNISLNITFTPATRVVPQPVYRIQWFIPDLIQSGSDYEFTAVDTSGANVLGSHVSGSGDEWIPKPEFTSAESVTK